MNRKATDFEVRHQTMLHLVIVALAFFTHWIVPGEIVSPGGITHIARRLPRLGLSGVYSDPKPGFSLACVGAAF